MSRSDENDPLAVIMLDHNYCMTPVPKGTIKIIKCPKVPEDEGSPSTSASVVPPKRFRSKSYSCDRIPDSGETLEESELVQYYSQWCDREYDTNKFLSNHRSPGARSLLFNDFKIPKTSRRCESLSISGISIPGPSTSSPIGNSNLDLLALCGTQELLCEEVLPDARGPANSSFESFDDDEFTAPRPESDYQVLAAANALLQLSSPVDHNGKLGNGTRKRKHSYHDLYEENRRENQLQINQMKMQASGVKTNSINPRSSAILRQQPSTSRLSNNTAGRKKRKKRKSKFNHDDSIENQELCSNLTHLYREPCDPSECKDGDVWGQAMPIKVLAKIFQYIAQAEGHSELLRIVSCVCRSWYTAASDANAWLYVDLSGEGQTREKTVLHWLCKNRLSKTIDLDLSYWDQLTGKDLQVISAHCPHLERLSLAHCSKLNSGAVRGLVESCTQLKHVDISSTSTVMTSKYLLDYLVELRGPVIQSLNLSGNILVKFDSVLQSIMDKCSELRLLDLSNVSFSGASSILALPLEELQIGCPKLAWLYLTNSAVKLPKVDGELESNGFPCLQTLNLARSTSGKVSKFITDKTLLRFLKNSPKLKYLSVSGCRHVSNYGLMRINMPHIQELHLAHCPLVSKDGFKDNLLKWRSSLQVLDLSGNALHTDLLKSFLFDNTGLENLTLTGCHGLPWNIRQEYRKDTLQELRQTLYSDNEASH